MNAPGIEVSVRGAQPSDARALCALRARAIRAIDGYYSRRERLAWIRTVTPRQLSRDIGTGGAACVLIAECDGKKCGFGWLREDIVWAVYVEPARRRSGIGSILLHALESQAHLQNQGALWVSASMNSVAFYVANGYQPHSSFRFSGASAENRVSLEALEMRRVLR